jgi:hypothetical protein
VANLFHPYKYIINKLGEDVMFAWDIHWPLEVEEEIVDSRNAGLNIDAHSPNAHDKLTHTPGEMQIRTVKLLTKGSRTVPAAGQLAPGPPMSECAPDLCSAFGLAQDRT